MSRPCVRPANRAQFQHRPVSFRWPRDATLRQIVEFNSLLFAQLETLIGPQRAVDMIVCSVMRVRW